MSTVERIEVSCDEPGCDAAIVLDDLGIRPGTWYVRSTLDLCPTHVRERVERPAPPAAPTAGTSSTEGITLTMSAHDAVMVAAALERELGSWEHPGTLRYEMREVIRQLHAQIEDYARRQP